MITDEKEIFTTLVGSMSDMVLIDTLDKIGRNPPEFETTTITLELPSALIEATKEACSCTPGLTAEAFLGYLVSTLASLGFKAKIMEITAENN